MKDRIKHIRKMAGINQTAFGGKIGVSQSAIAGYENGTRVPIDAIIVAIAKEFNVSEEWLRTGSGEPFIEMTDEDEIMAWVGSVLKGKEESTQKRTLKYLSQLADTDWQALDALVSKGMAILSRRDEK